MIPRQRPPAAEARLGAVIDAGPELWTTAARAELARVRALRDVDALADRLAEDLAEPVPHGPNLAAITARLAEAAAELARAHTRADTTAAELPGPSPTPYAHPAAQRIAARDALRPYQTGRRPHYSRPRMIAELSRPRP